MISTTLHEAHEPARQLANPFGLAKAYRFRRDQFPAHAKCNGAREDKFGCILLIHTT